jgi:restriction system protein
MDRKFPVARSCFDLRDSRHECRAIRASDLPFGRSPLSSETEEAPLLHEPDLMLAVLRASACKVATLDDCIRQLGTLLRVAREPPPADPEELLARLIEVRDKLLRAELIRSAGPGGFEITERGRGVLEENPGGVDESVLIRFPEYRGAVAERATGASRRPGAAAYDAGYAAHLAGRTLADNPHPPDRRDHLDWQNGWSQARDDEVKPIADRRSRD